MALEVRPIDARLQIQFDLGLGQNGRRVTRTKTISSIKSDVLDQDLYEVANALIGLQEHPVAEIRKVSQSEYVEV